MFLMIYKNKQSLNNKFYGKENLKINSKFRVENSYLSS